MAIITGSTDASLGSARPRALRLDSYPIGRSEPDLKAVPAADRARPTRLLASAGSASI
jgi:hypothetical protein